MTDIATDIYTVVHKWIRWLIFLAITSNTLHEAIQVHAIIVFDAGNLIIVINVKQLQSTFVRITVN